MGVVVLSSVSLAVVCSASIYLLIEKLQPAEASEGSCNCAGDSASAKKKEKLSVCLCHHLHSDINRLIKSNTLITAQMPYC